MARKAARDAKTKGGDTAGGAAPTDPAARRGSALALVAAEPARRLTAAEFRGLAKVPPEAEWFANITRRAYQADLRGFMGFVGIVAAGEVRKVTRSHVLAWRKELEDRGLAGASIRRKLSAVASLFDHLCDSHAVGHNPLRGVQRPKADVHEGKTPAIGDG